MWHTQRSCSQLCHQLQAAPCCAWLFPIPPPSVGWKGAAGVSYSSLYPSSGVCVPCHTQPQTPGCWCFLSHRHVMRLRRSQERRSRPLGGDQKAVPNPRQSQLLPERQSQVLKKPSLPSAKTRGPGTSQGHFTGEK